MEKQKANETPADTATDDIAAGLASGAKPGTEPAKPGAEPPRPGSGTDAPKPDASTQPVGMVSLADVQRMIQQGVAAATEGQMLQADAMMKRHQFLTEKMKNFPPFITSYAPMTGDQKVLDQWASKVELEFNAAFKAELEKHGLLQAYYNKTSIGGPPAGGVSPAEWKPTLSGVSPVDLIEQGLREKQR